jgi:hypothetical protein
MWEQQELKKKMRKAYRRVYFLPVPEDTGILIIRRKRSFKYNKRKTSDKFSVGLDETVNKFQAKI